MRHLEAFWRLKNGRNQVEMKLLNCCCFFVATKIVYVATKVEFVVTKQKDHTEGATGSS